MSESGPLIIESRDGDVVTLTFNDPDHLNAMTEAMPDCTHVVIEGAGHSVQGDQPAAMVAALDAFLSERLGRS